jgi:HlyD family secretion protein
MTRGRAGLSLLAVGVLTTGAWLAIHWKAEAPIAAARPGSPVPTVRVARGSLALDVYMTGELRASRQMNVVAPAVGGTLRILRMVETGTAVKTGDVVMEFDPAEQQYLLEQARSELAEAEQEIIKRQADVAVQRAQDKVQLLTAQFDVRRAELDALVEADLISANDYRIRQVSLDEAKQKLAQVQQDVTSRAATSEASLALVQERRAKARVAADRAEQSIGSLEVTAPMDGLVVVRENRDAAGGFFFTGMTLPPYRTGDNVYAGRPIVDVFDVTGMEIKAKVNEQERDNVAVGQAAIVQSDAVPGTPLTAKVTSVAGLASGRFDFGPVSGPARQFDTTLQLEGTDPRLRPGTSVRVVVQGRRIDDVLVLPRQAVFDKDGKPATRVRSRDGFEVRQIKVLYRTESRVAIEGLDEGAEVALIDPDRVPLAASSPAGSSSAGGGK